MMKPLFAIGSASVLCLSACSVWHGEPDDLPGPVERVGESDEAIAADPGLSKAPNELLVQWRAGATRGAKYKARQKLNATKVETIHTSAMRSAGKGELEVVRLPPGLSVAAAVGTLSGDAAVEFSEPNWVYTHHATANDPYFTSSNLWGMYGDASSPVNEFGCQAAEAWSAGAIGSNTVYVGVIDEGIFTGHEDLAANIWVNPFDPVDGKDNDGNGYVDDRNGWDFAYNDAGVYNPGADTHGTHVAGTIGAVGGNGKGVAGVVWNVQLISGKFLGAKGGTTANAIKAIDYMVDLKVRHGLRIVALNNSWGGGGYSKALFDAIERANAVDILFVVAAGNGGSDGVGDDNDVVANYPSNYENANVLAVGALTSTGDIASYSNYGGTTVDIFAPGSGIYSTLPKYAKKKVTSTYGAYNGTSMATPHVTGAAALFASLNPSATAADIKGAILASANSTPSAEGKCATGGRLDVSSLGASVVP